MSEVAARQKRDAGESNDVTLNTDGRAVEDPIDRMSGQLSDAYDACLRVARSHYENFPVASWLLPARLRPHIAAIYAFARIADDFADEPGPTIDQRLRALDAWGQRLEGLPSADPSVFASAGCRLTAADLDSVFLALHDTMKRFDLPLTLFSDLLSAFRQDVTTNRYATWSDVLDYCRRSANPVGRLVLRVFGNRRDDLDAASDALCTALQLTNFWQDLAIDWSRGRLYVPEEVWRSHDADLATLSNGEISEAWKASLRDVSQRTRRLFEEGRSVCDGVSGRLRFELQATWLGGVRVIDRLEHSGFDVFGRRPKLGLSDALVIAWGTAVWKR